MFENAHPNSVMTETVVLADEGQNIMEINGENRM
jgi:hypothetical protein